MAPAGWFVVDTEQPLGMLAGYLLEPASEDGVAAWNLVDPAPAPGSTYPVLRALAPVRASAQALP